MKVSHLLLPASLALCCASSLLQAAGFSVVENSASGMGNAFAGGAAAAEDASTVWSNPAGMAELADKRQVSTAVHWLMPEIAFTNAGSQVNPALTGGNVAAAQAALGGANTLLDKAGAIPNLYAVYPINDKTKAGLAVNVPFGLETDYDAGWYGRYHALKSAMKTLNVNPAISYEVNDKLAVGGGVSAQYIEVELSSAVDSAAACRSIAAAAKSAALLARCVAAFPSIATPATDSQAVIKGDDWSLNYNAGLLYKPTPKTKLGVSYRSATQHNLEGSAAYTVNAALQPVLAATGVTRFNDAPAVADAEMPATLSLSAAHKVNDKVEVLADITRTQWSSFERLTVKNAETGAIVTDVDESWQDVNRYAVGLNYQHNERLKLRTGVALDETPIPDTPHRTARIPDNERTWGSVGANYKLKKISVWMWGIATYFLMIPPSTIPIRGQAIPCGVTMTLAWILSAPNSTGLSSNSPFVNAYNLCDYWHKTLS